MEHQIFSQQGLSPEVIASEEKIWTDAIEKTREALEKEVDFILISNIFANIYKKCLPNLSEEEINKKLAGIVHPRYEVLYSLSGKTEEEYIKGKEKDNNAETDGIKIRYSARDYYEKGKIDITSLVKSSIHELLHIVADKNETNEDLFSTGVSVNSESSFEENPLFFNKTNEGLTEFISDAVYSEYMARKGEMITTEKFTGEDKDGVRYNLAPRNASYIGERLDIYILMNELQKITELPLERICQRLVKEYITNGDLLREEIVTEFREYPEVINTLEKLKRNHVTKFSEEELDRFEEEIQTTELVFAKTLFGRDAVGEYNKKIIDSLK